MSSIQIEKMEIGNLACAHVEDKVYVGAAEEWCSVETGEGGEMVFKMVDDAALCRRLRRAYVEMNFQEFGSLVRTHLAKRGKK